MVFFLLSHPPLHTLNYLLMSFKRSQTTFGRVFVLSASTTMLLVVKAYTIISSSDHVGRGGADVDDCLLNYTPRLPRLDAKNITQETRSSTSTKVVVKMI